jgi:hypothetical protein
MKRGATPMFYTDRYDSIDVTQYLGRIVLIALELETSSPSPRSTVFSLSKETGIAISEPDGSAAYKSIQ